MSDPKKRVDDPYTNRARKEGFLARSVYKLEEIDQKFHLFDSSVTTALDIGCAPWSRLQYISKKLEAKHKKTGGREPVIVWFDLKTVEMQMPYVHAYPQDITDHAAVRSILEFHGIETFDVIVSDMAPDTIGTSDIDAMRSIGLIEKTLRLYEEFLKENGNFAIKVFMGPGFDELVRDLKKQRWASTIRIFKPKACRKESKETYIVRVGK